jgi:hypothetical protein
MENHGERPSRLQLGALLVASTVWVVAIGIAAALLVGPLAGDDDLVDPDYSAPPLPLHESTQLAFGAALAAGCAATGEAIRRWYRRAGLVWDWCAGLVPMGALAAYVGFWYGVASSPTIGANIGAGVLLLGAIPFAAAAFFIGRRVAGPVPMTLADITERLNAVHDRNPDAAREAQELLPVQLEVLDDER